VRANFYRIIPRYEFRIPLATRMRLVSCAEGVARDNQFQVTRSLNHTGQADLDGLIAVSFLFFGLSFLERKRKRDVEPGCLGFAQSSLTLEDSESG